MHFSKKSGSRSSVGPEILAFVSHSSKKFQPISDCFVPNFKLRCGDSENIKTNRINTVIFNLLQIKRQAFFMGHPIVAEINSVHQIMMHINIVELKTSGNQLGFFWNNKNHRSM